MPDHDPLFRALADPTRRRLLHLLALREWCVGDLATVLDVSQPTVSRHLAHLRGAELVKYRRDAQWLHYRLAPGPGPVQSALLDAVRACAAQPGELADDRLRADALTARGGCCPGAATATSAAAQVTGSRGGAA